MRHDLVEHVQTLEECSFDGARATLTKWTRAVASGQIEEILGLYAHDAILVPTLSNEIAVTQDGRRRYFEFFLSDGGPTCTVDSETFRSDRNRGTVTIGGIYTFCFPRPTGEETVPARFLLNIEDLDAGGLITGHHSSRCI